MIRLWQLVQHQRIAKRLDAANFIMDFLKTEAPFWKSENTSDGANWVSARETDNKAKRRW